MSTGLTSALEAKVIHKSNKYVYFNDGTHMTYSDFHKLKMDIRKEYATLNYKQYEDSIRLAVVNLEDWAAVEKAANGIPPPALKETTDWQELYRNASSKCDELRHETVQHGRKLYKDLAELPILKTLQVDKGIKFIIQGSEDNFRFCFDPYQLMSNYHSSLSEMYRDLKFYTKNGGWLMIIGNKVILYAKSGDYGVYEDAIAIEAAKKIFPDKEIFSHAGVEWDVISEMYEERELPF